MGGAGRARGVGRDDFGSFAAFDRAACAWCWQLRGKLSDLDLSSFRRVTALRRHESQQALRAICNLRSSARITCLRSASRSAWERDRAGDAHRGVLTAPRRQSLRRAARGGERYHPVPHSTHGSRARRADHERVAGKGWDWRRHGDGRVREAAKDPKSKGLPALGVRAACLAARGKSRGHVEWGCPA